MRPVFINGLGCFESGARVVLRELMQAYPGDGPRAVLVLPSCNRDDLGELPSQVRVVALNHRVFGRWLRPLYEAVVAGLARVGYFSRVVNLSHYGWCPGGAYVLYFHNQLLVEEGHDVWSGQGGRPNGFKRWCLRTCLRRAAKIVVQTERVAGRVRDYAGRHGIAPGVIEVVAPRAGARKLGAEALAKAGAAEKVFARQLFYPASVFPHKRPELAVSGVVEANKADPRIGLVLTLPAPPEGAPACIRYVGTLTSAQVAATYAVSDVLLFTSAHETLGLPLLEALEAGLPAVLPALDYARDIYGEAGSYFERESGEAVGAAILDGLKRGEESEAKLRERRETVRVASKSWAEHWGVFGVGGGGIRGGISTPRPSGQNPAT